MKPKSEWEENWNVDEIKWRIDELERIFKEARLHKNILGGDGLPWNKNGDLRYRVFVHLVNEINVAHLSSHFILRMSKDEFWKGQEQMTDYDRLLTLRNYDNSTFLTFFMGIYMCVENLFRACIREIEPDMATKRFKVVYDHLIDQIAYHNNWRSLLELYRTMRNGIHNLFVHTGPDVKIQHFGHEYEFVNLEPINFYGWGLLINMTSTIIHETRTFVESPDIFSIDKVSDPYFDFEVKMK